MRTKKERPWGWPQAFLPETEKLKNVLSIQTYNRSDTEMQ